MVRGRLQQQEKSGDSPIYQGSLRGLPDVFSTPLSRRTENPPSRPPLPGFEGRTVEYLPAGVTTRELERRVEEGWGQGKIRTIPPRLQEVRGGWNTSEG